jgi:hypothetical protein
MSAYTLAVVVHVVVAVLGVGQLGAIAVAASAARRSGAAEPQAATWLGLLLRYTRWSLAAMFATGIWIDLAASGVYRHAWWARVSAALMVVAFLLLRRALGLVSRVAAADGSEAPIPLLRLERTAWSMCAIVGLITILMEAKPF